MSESSHEIAPRILRRGLSVIISDHGDGRPSLKVCQKGHETFEIFLDTHEGRKIGERFIAASSTFPPKSHRLRDAIQCLIGADEWTLNAALIDTDPDIVTAVKTLWEAGQ